MSTLLDKIAQLEKQLDRIHNELRGKVDAADRKIAESNNLISIMRGKEKLSAGIKSYLDDFFKSIDAFERDLLKSMPMDFPKEFCINVQEMSFALDAEKYLAQLSDSFIKLQRATKGLENEEDEDSLVKDVKQINTALSELKGYKKLYSDFMKAIISLENTELSTGVDAEEQKKAAVAEKRTQERMAAVQAATPLWSEMLETIKQEKAARTKNNLTNTPVLVEEFPDSLDLFLGYKVESSRSINYPLFGWGTTLSGGQPYYIDLSKKVPENKLNCLAIRPAAGSSSKDGLKEIIHNLVMQFICQIPATYKKVAFGDSDGLLTTIRARIQQKEIADLFYGNANDPRGCDDLVSRIRAEIIKREGDLQDFGKNGENKFFDYNKKNTDNPLPAIMVLLSVFPGSYSEESLTALKQIAAVGRDHGIYLVIITEELEKYDKDRENSYDSKKTTLWHEILEKAEYSFTYEKELLLTSASCAVKCDIRSADFDQERFFAKYRELLEEKKKALASVSFPSVLDSTPFERSVRRKEFSEKLSIPLGKENGKVVNFELSTITDAHAIVNGTTGSGKSKMLHTLILSGCTHYSPEELEIYVFDFKGGNEMSEYATDFPHMKLLSLGIGADSAADVLSYLMKKKEERSDLFNIYGVNDISGYNRKAQEEGFKIMPRMLVIIDEYQKCIESARVVDMLLDIASQGRSAGISLILASQQLPGLSDFSKVMSQLTIRVVFNSTDKDYSSLLPSTSFKNSELVTGTCVLSTGKTGLNMVRVAFAGKESEDRKPYRDAIRAAFPNAPVETRVFRKSESGIMVEIKEDQYRTFKEELSLLNPKRKVLDGRLSLPVGRNLVANDIKFYDINEKNTLLYLLGEKVKADRILMTMISPLLHLYTEYGVCEPRIFYLDFKPSRFDMPLMKALFAKQAEYSDPTSPLFKKLATLSYSDGKSADAAIDAVYSIYRERRDNLSSAEFSPVEVIINPVDSIVFSGETEDKYKELIKEGKEVAIFFVFISEEWVDRYGDFEGIRYPIKDMILLDDEANLGNVNKFEEADKDFLRRSMKSNPISEATAILIDDGVCARIKVPDYNVETYIDSLVNNL